MMIDSIAQLAATLFVLSMVNERVVSLIKETFSGKLWLGNLKVKSEDKTAEDSRDRRILQINIFTGILVAWAADTDLIELFKKMQGEASNGAIETPFAWLTSALGYALKILGYTLTGCFTSFGSKFWHDLLDIVLAIKNIKQDGTPANQTPSSTGLFGQLSPEAKAEQIRAAISTHSIEWIKGFSNVIGCQPGIRVKDGVPTGEHVIQFRVQKKDGDKSAIAVPVPASITLGNGMSIPTDIVEGSTAKACWKNPGNHEPPVVMGTSISRDDLTPTGTIGLRVSKTIGGKKTDCLLTCFHVIFPDKLQSDEENITIPDTTDGPECIIPGNDTNVGPTVTIGKAICGSFTEDTDAALVSVTSYAVENLEKCKVPIKLFDYKGTTLRTISIFFEGAKSGKMKNFTWTPDSSERIEYDNGKGRLVYKTITDLICLNGDAADGGDSGSIVLTSEGEIMGMVVASDRKNQTWVKPLQGLDKQLGFTF